MAFPAPDPEFLGLLPGRGASVRPVGSRGCRRASGESPLRAQHRRPRLLLPPRPQSWVPATTSPRLGQLHRDPRSSWNPGWLWGAPYWPWPNPTPGTMRSQGPRGTCPRLQGVSRDPPRSGGPLRSAVLSTRGQHPLRPGLCAPRTPSRPPPLPGPRNNRVVQAAREEEGDIRVSAAFGRQGSPAPPSEPHPCRVWPAVPWGPAVI